MRAAVAAGAMSLQLLGRMMAGAAAAGEWRAWGKLCKRSCCCLNGRGQCVVRVSRHGTCDVLRTRLAWRLSVQGGWRDIRTVLVGEARQ